MEQEDSRSLLQRQGGQSDQHSDDFEKKSTSPKIKRSLVDHDLDRLLVYTKRVRNVPTTAKFLSQQGNTIAKKRKIQLSSNTPTQIKPRAEPLCRSSKPEETQSCYKQKKAKELNCAFEIPNEIQTKPSHNPIVVFPSKKDESCLPISLSEDKHPSQETKKVGRYRRHSRTPAKKSKKRGSYDSEEENCYEKFPYPNHYVEHISGSHLDFLAKTEEIKQVAEGQHNLPSKTFVNCDVRFFNWDFFSEKVGSFDVVLIDPPWRIKGAQQNDSQFMFSNCKFSLEYNTMSNCDIANIEIEKLSNNGFIFLWILNTQLGQSLEIMNKWGYQLVDQLIWVKLKNEKIFLTNGFYFMHSYEMCLIGYKSHPSQKNHLNHPIADNALFAEVRKKSQKPDELYYMIEMMFPTSKKVEVFARNNNLRFGWFSLGNELGESYDKWLVSIECDRCSTSIVPTVRRFKSKSKANFDLCENCVTEEEKPGFYEIDNQITENVIHLYRSCNKCEVEPIWGNRFECKVCPNFDLCEACFDHNLQLEQHFHNPNHEMVVDELPIFGNGFPIHDMKCSVCYQKPIIGTRFSCGVCKNHNLCQKCFFDGSEETKSKRHTEDHQISAVFDPSLKPIPKRFECFSCNKEIEEDCWMCENCYNFFFCGCCYAKRQGFKTNMANNHKDYHRFCRVF